MADKAHALVLWRTEHSLLSVEDLASAAGVQTGIVETFVRLRLIEPTPGVGFDQLFPASTVYRLQRIVHLRQDLGVNLGGCRGYPANVRTYGSIAKGGRISS